MNKSRKINKHVVVKTYDNLTNLIKPTVLRNSQMKLKKQLVTRSERLKIWMVQNLQMFVKVALL